MADDRLTSLAGPPSVPTDIARFTSNTLFGQPGIYPDGPPMEPASGHRHSDASIEQVLVELVGTVAEPLFEAWNANALSVNQLVYGVPAAPGRVVGPAADGVHVVNDRYRAEDPRLLLPSIVHALVWSGAGAGHAEETVLHALGAYVHAQLLARDPALASTGTELARRQNSITITLLNSRAPGDATITLMAPNGPGTIPGGAPTMQSPDFWSVPFGPAATDGAPIGATVAAMLDRASPGQAPGRPNAFGDPLGTWCSSALSRVLDPPTQLGANRALGLLP